ncbi:MAG TPA: DnaJ C-terminal domain-containing protein [Pyrinomonadaceae bacterium]|nr:DnaJ C-terminal domain-containing protein [Pyrinomonadaceae bacterium]
MRNKSERGEDLRYDVKLTLLQAATGTVAQLNIPRLSCDICSGTGMDMPYMPCLECHGSGWTKTENLEVKIPPGAETGTRLRIQGKGGYGIQGGEAGDLYIVVYVAEHRIFERQGNNLYTSVSVTDKQCVQGLAITVPSLIDGPQQLKLPVGVQVGNVFRLPNLGMPVLGGDARGDLYVKINQIIPEDDQKNTHVKSKLTLRVFLCHSSGDKPAVRKIYHRLLADGVSAWLDEENLLPGQRWEQEIPKAVRDSDVVIVCLSQSSINKKGYLQKEIRYALDVADEQPEGTIFLIPLKLEECDIPEHLRRWQWVNFFEDRGYDRLMMALRRRMGGP